MPETPNTFEFAHNLDVAKYDAWFQDPAGRSWKAAHEIKMRVMWANLHPAGEQVGPNTSKTGDPGFDAMLKKVCDIHDGHQLNNNAG